MDEMLVANRELTLAGVIVLAPGVFLGADAGEITDEQKVALGDLHLRKIDLADRVLIVNPGGYLGESTRREIAYAHATRKPVSYTDPT
ncbi:putative phosphodiesterase [Kribbella italica]|uniref:Putative phosphodiesterase n=2 Tax=Kribbella italica TaxID=1540520 RepID=A0A7W9JDE5_9ACTN|nr:putative phosphodiesterase [Kribbella italica]